ncbi:hypothetical protein A2V49_01820 [candidate division WWE3 bacterium RBG_19FT_COMBO_34_6]|uniref:Uncharacterized protein n=1 Tax=candidate division WWE3 bacterium RBG_19FT_COMBO_34_6 TaxID=1802612 RepID=A0A1F4UME9_UNCKA|nr:MAG: hypothetical protein A2V49_01820 [candidate division WWE3 bacterium RBG_19FT_COMBO_34_6]
MGLIRALKVKSETYHMHVHALLGLLTSLIIYKIYEGSDFSNLMILGVAANILPDIDHLFFIFIYGSKTDYSKVIKKYLRKHQLKTLVTFIKQNHKLNTSVYSHNIATVLLVCIGYMYFGYSKDNPYFSTFFLSWMIHYLYDIFEDLMFFGKLNRNWLLKFDRSFLLFENFIHKDKNIKL